MSRASAVLLVLVVVGLVTGCASSAPAPPSPSSRSVARPFETVRRVAVVVSGDTRFSVIEHSAEPGRTFDEVMKWNSALAVFRPIAQLLHRGINWLLAFDRTGDTEPEAEAVSPRAVVADAFARTLQASTEFDEIQVVEREPLGDDRRRLDAIIRLTVPAWGLVRVREGEPDLISGFADVRAQLVARGTGVVLWEASEDVTDPERLPLASFTGDKQFTRHHLVEVLERAGQRLANELVYARSGGR
jgi:hypothetical protein